MSFKLAIASILIASTGLSGWWFWQQRNESACAPVLFVHGFGGKGNDWLKRNYDKIFLDSPEFHYEGDVAVKEGRAHLEIVRSGSNLLTGHPFFTVSLRNHAFDAIPDLGADIEASIDEIRNICHCDHVCLVGFSLGGVVCRDYLVRHPLDAKVDKLVTISSPHQGSAFAFLSDFSKSIKSQQKTSFTDELGEAAFVELNELCLEHQIDLYSKSLAMLKPPSAGNYLDWLNHKPHPANVQYYSIVTLKSAAHYSASDAIKDASKLADGQVIDTAVFAAGTDLVRMGIDWITNNAVSFGDGFVSVDSQDMASLPAFADAKLSHKRIEVSSTHFNDLLQKELVSLILQKR